MNFRSPLPRIIRWLIVLVLLANGMAYMHAYHFTHFARGDDVSRTAASANIPLSEKVMILLTGPRNPRPQNKKLPALPYQTHTIEGTTTLEAWLIDAATPQGTVALFHGYASQKSDLLPVAEAFHALGYRTLLIDFPGSGGSEGNSTTIGYQEAEDVRAVYEYIYTLFPGEKLILYGFSMGAVAMMRAVSAYDIAPDALIIGCPFTTLHETVQHRFRMLGVPPIPMATLLTFWGGVQHGYWAFDHNPVEYAQQIRIPTLLMYGQQDQRVTLAETKRIYQALAGSKWLEVFEQADHELYVCNDPPRWKQTVTLFMQSCQREQEIRQAAYRNGAR